MPFLAPLIPAIAGGVASAGVGAVAKAITGSGNTSTPQAAPIERSVNNIDTARSIGQSNEALNQQQSLANQLAAQGGIQNQSSVFNQLQNVANGQGPNPAQAMLAQATGQNAAQQAALMAGQRGAAANTGLLARQAAQQGGALQQQAAGQGAVLQANQSLNALGQLGGLAGQQVSQQMNQANTYANSAQGQQAQLLNALQGQNQLAVGQQGQLNQINAANQQQQGQFNQQNMQGLTSGIGSAVASAVTPKKMAEGGMIDVIGKENYKGKSRIGMHLMAKGGAVHNMMQGGHVPGKPEVGGHVDSYANDKVKALLSPGEYVIPRSITQSKDPKAIEVMKLVKALNGEK